MTRRLALIAVLLWTTRAQAQTPGPVPPGSVTPADPAPEDIWGGGCALYNHDGIAHVRAPTCRLSVHFSLGLVLTSLDLVTYKARAGSDAVPLGPCYSITYQPKRWYASGLNFCLSVVASQDSPTTVFPSSFVRVLKWGAFGAGPLFTARSNGGSGMFTHWILLTGANIPIQ